MSEWLEVGTEKKCDRCDFTVTVESAEQFSGWLELYLPDHRRPVLCPRCRAELDVWLKESPDRVRPRTTTKNPFLRRDPFWGRTIKRRQP